MSYHDDVLMNFREEYKKVRDRFKEEDFPTGETVVTDDPWATGMPEMEEQGPSPEQLPQNNWNLDEMDDDLRELDHLHGRQAPTREEYEEIIGQHPLVQEYGGQMEEILQQLYTQMQDPNDPMTPQEAQQMFTQLMMENFSDKF